MLLLEQFEHLTLHPKNAARLKELVLQLAMQGKLTESWRNQNPHVEPASELLRRIEAEKAQLIKEKKIKKEKSFYSISEKEVPFEVPDSWVWSPLQSVFLIITDGDHQAPPQASEGLPFLVIGNVRSGNLSFENSRYVPHSYYDKLDWIKKPQRGDILYTVVGSYGISVLIKIDEPFCVQRHIAILKSSKEISKSYLDLTLKSKLVYSQATEYSTGIAQKTVPLSGLRAIIIPLPPLAEQEAIVARVEELMQKIEELEKANQERIQLQKSLGAAALQALTTAPDEELEQQWIFLKQNFQTIFGQEANVKKLRETILQLAVQGKLTSAWRKQNPTTQPAAELLKQIQAEKAQLVKEKKIKKEESLDSISDKDTPFELPLEWKWCRWIDVSYKIGDVDHKMPNEVVDGFPYVSPKDFREGNFIDFEGSKKISKEDFDQLSKKIIPENGDLIFPRYGTIGENRLVVTDRPFLASYSCAIVKTFHSYIESLFIYYYSFSPLVKGEIEKYINRTTQPNVGVKSIKSFLFPLPPIAEQRVVVDKVGQLMRLCDNLEQQLKLSNQEVEALMQAVVQEALQMHEGVTV